MAETRVHEAAAAPADGDSKLPDSGRGADSLFKNAYFLMLSTGVSAVLGLGFWLVAARYYSEEAVGQGSAAIAAMRLLASITATTMIGAVVRFVPRAGRATGTLVWRTYAASSVIVALAAVVFLLTLDLWGASYAPLGTLEAGTLFVAACVAWALLTLQDGVLTGLRKAEWVPAGNAVFSVGKLILLAVFASALPVLGIFVSWAVAIAFSTLPLGWLIFRRLIPRQAAADRDVEPPRFREMGRFLAGDSLGALFSLAMINLLPVMVAVRFTAAENGYFYVAYTVGGTMEFMAINMASSLTAHASHDPRRLADGVRGALRRMTLLLVPVVLVLVVFAPQILAPFDADYAEHGSTVLRLLAIGALPRIVVELYIGVLRVQGRTGVLAAVQGAMCTLVLGSAAVLFTPAGIAGAGWAVLLSMTVVAVGCVPGLRAALRGIDASGGTVRPGDDREPRPGSPAYGTRWARLNATAGYGTNWARRAAYEERDQSDEAAREDTVTLFIGRPGYEREALEADALAVIVRPQQPDSGGEAGAGTAAEDRGGPGGPGGPGDSGGPDDRKRSASGAEAGEGAEANERAAPYDRAGPYGLGGWYEGGESYRQDGDESETAERRLRIALWALLGAATVAFWAALRELPWLSGDPGTGAELTGRELLEGLPLTALLAGAVLLVVFVASVTLCTRPDPWLPGAALGAAVLALYAAPVALGREPQPVDGALYSETAGFLADAVGLDGPGPLLRWAPLVLQLLCLVPLWLLLAHLRGRLPWSGRWGVLYLAAVGGWVWRQALAQVAPPLLLLLVLVVLLLSLRRPAFPTEPPHRTRSNDRSRD
ncbi:lipopolysaccharide biosynthesis protein [Streptomyces sp. TRM S81-3]|uniref:Lipopolysaccharide biosynthesis protein n=1 Tax=Streptomyces griseicoloratus TaxID=2752516 RepID=A0A926LC19_9ACTN|nr:lipopolysaccharide biosynthesis protein [Streptomyces griseicoloratus]MBD0423813.1 lipopolysaccharide biosynthesis protein [Streptomyces griseicoloratus]